MTEASLKRALVKVIRTTLPGVVLFRHEDKFTGGVPDISLTWRGVTSWIEVKYSRPKRRGLLSALQRLTLDRIACAGGNAWLLTYAEGSNGRWSTSLQPWSPTSNQGGCQDGRAHVGVAEWLSSAHLRPKVGYNGLSGSGRGNGSATEAVRS